MSIQLETKYYALESKCKQLEADLAAAKEAAAAPKPSGKLEIEALKKEVAALKRKCKDLEAEKKTALKGVASAEKTLEKLLGKK